MKRKAIALLLCLMLVYNSSVPTQAAIKTPSGVGYVFDGTIIGSLVHLRSTMSTNGWGNVICTLSNDTGYYDHGISGINGGIRWRHITVASGEYAGWSGYVNNRYTSQGTLQY